MKTKSFQQTLEHIASQRTENLKKLLDFSLSNLIDLKEYYYNWYKSAEEDEYKESAIVNQMHYHLIEEAIKIRGEN